MPEQPCARCGRPIPPERLEALPETRVCVACAAAMGGSDFELVPVEERTSKAESYKHRFGVAGLARVPKPIVPVRRKT